MQRVQDFDIYKERKVEIGQNVIYSDLIEYIEKIGYEKVDNVIEVGTYANRGGIVDLFSPNYNYPIRLDFLVIVLKLIRYFDFQNQKTIKSTNYKYIPISEIYFFLRIILIIFDVRISITLRERKKITYMKA